MSRKAVPGLQSTAIQGDFGSFEDLRKLDTLPIDMVVHLGAVTGGCSERDGVLVNCEGTRCLMRYLMDRGCDRFVMASSIAVIGMQNVLFRPLSVPISDTHPCFDRDGYGFSKHLMEELTRYYALQKPSLDILNLRLSSVAKNDAVPSGMRSIRPWALGSITVTLVSDIVDLIVKAVERPYSPGVRTYNASCSKVWATVPTAELLSHWWGNDIDLSYYHRSGHEYDSAYDTHLIEKELGFVAKATLETLERSGAGVV